jgi:hypothetical protein
MLDNIPVTCLQCKGEEPKGSYEAWNAHVEKHHNYEARYFRVNFEMMMTPKDVEHERTARKRQRLVTEQGSEELGTLSKSKKVKILAERQLPELGQALDERNSNSNIDPRLEELWQNAWDAGTMGHCDDPDMFRGLTT